MANFSSRHIFLLKYGEMQKAKHMETFVGRHTSKNPFSKILPKFRPAKVPPKIRASF